MKRIIVLFVFVCFAKIDIAQVYQPFPTDSASWIERSQQWNIPWMDQQDYEYFLDGDTVLLGLNYHKLFKTKLESDYQLFGSGPFVLYAGPYMTDTNKYIGAIREDGLKRIYFFPDTATITAEQLLYDFNLNVGDTLPYSYNNSSYFLGQNYVSQIDSILLGSVYHKRFQISSYAGYPDYVSIIEGVGSTFGLLEMFIDPFEWSDNLTCYKHNGTTVYTDGAFSTTCSLPTPVGINEHSQENQISLFPNPSTGIVNLKTPFSEKAEIEICDVLGSRILYSEHASFEFSIDLSQQQKGIYFLKAKSGNKISTTQKIVLQ